MNNALLTTSPEDDTIEPIVNDAATIERYGGEDWQSALVDDVGRLYDQVLEGQSELPDEWISRLLVSQPQADTYLDPVDGYAMDRADVWKARDVAALSVYLFTTHTAGSGRKLPLDAVKEVVSAHVGSITERGEQAIGTLWNADIAIPDYREGTITPLLEVQVLPQPE